MTEKIESDKRRKRSQSKAKTTISNIISTKECSLTPQKIFKICSAFVKFVVLQVYGYIRCSNHMC